MRKLYVTVFILFFTVSVFSQMDYQIQLVKAQFKERLIVPPSPDAASLGAYGNVPVSMFTGIPNINIPLMELKGKFLNLPVSMSYYASGFKPEEIASWVGLSWSLNAGGAITRSVAGAPDIEYNYFKSPYPIKEPNNMGEFNKLVYYKEIADGFHETQPDVYYYNFMGKSGKFFISPTGNVLKKEKDMLLIYWDGDDFTIKDENGNVFVFTQREITRTAPTDEVGGLPLAYTFTSSWFLSSVTSADGTETLLFEYYTPTQEQTIYQGATQKQSKTWIYLTSSCSSSSSSTELSQNTTMPTPTRITRKFLKKVRLIRSGVDIGYIDFESLLNHRQDLWQADFDGERMLDAVKMYSYLNGTTILTRNYKLQYSYFPTTETAYGGLRLRLDKIQEISLKTGTPDMPAYQFEYNNGSLPRRYSYSLDHWGYYNGASQNSLIPSVSATIDGSNKMYGDNADRSPDFNYASRALMQKIIYPTGGYTTFEFEDNSGKGGVRIKKISDYSFDGTVAGAKSYSYALARSKGTPSYSRNANYSSFSQGCVGTGCNCPSTGRKSVTISSTSIYGLGFLNGASVVYGRVTESTSNATGDIVGSTVTTFEAGLQTEGDDDIRSGAIKLQQFYANGGLLIKEISNTYSYHEIAEFGGLRIVPEVNQDNKTIMCEQNVNGYLQIGYYFSSSGQSCIRTAIIPTRFTHYDLSKRLQWFPMTQQIVKEYHPASGNYLTTTKKFTYGINHTNPILIEEQSSNNNEVVITSIKSIADYLYDAVTNDVTALSHKTANSRNIKTLEVEKLQYRQNADGSNKRYIAGQISTYQANGLPDNILRLEISAPLTSFTPSSVTEMLSYAPQYKSLGYFKYDASQSLVEQGKADDIPTSYIWDHDSKFPIASVSNASQSNIAYTSFETAGTGGWTIVSPGMYSTNKIMGNRSMTLMANTLISKTFSSLTTLKQIVSYWSQETSITVKSNGTVAPPVQVLVVNGWTYFEHFVPAGISTIEVSGVGITIDELRTYPINSYMTTYNYGVAEGLISQCGPQNKISYFEYDGLRRLVNEKDSKNNIVKNYKYNYGLGQAIVQDKILFYNTKKQENFTKNDGCPTGAYPSTGTYIVEAGKHWALTQAQADLLAESDIIQNGQNYVNGAAKCYWKSVSMVKTIYKECEYHEGWPEPLVVGVYTGEFTSFESQEDADRKALALFSSYDQNYANERGKCACEDEGERFIGGVKCAKGTRINYAYSWIPTMGQYKCTYYYLFSDGSISQHYYDYSSSPCYAL